MILKKNAGSADDYINANYLDVSNILCFLFFKDISISSVSNSNLAVVINAWYILTELYFLYRDTNAKTNTLHRKVKHALITHCIDDFDKYTDFQLSVNILEIF